MGKLFITRENLGIFIKNIKKECDEFIAPKREHLDDIVFGDTKDDGKELLDYEGNSVISPRAFLLPQTEPLFEIRSAENCGFITIDDKKKRVFYGIRPCDIKALVLMRQFFLDEFTPLEIPYYKSNNAKFLTGFIDVPYKEKLENSTFIALSCNKRCSQKSFCYEIDAGPVAKNGFDLQLTSLKRGYIVDIGSKKGSHIVKRNKKLFSKTTLQDEKESKDIFKNFTQETKRIDYKKLAKIMKQDRVRESIWDDIGLRCVVCSGCITLCPTCSCFSIVDRLNGDRGMRMRYCDGCPYAGFMKMAGGNTPQPLHKYHIRRFFEHKLNVDVARYKTPSCVGCARCIETCPGNISIRKFIDEAMNL